MSNEKKKTENVSELCLVSPTIRVTPEQLLSDMHFNVVFPDGIPQIDLQKGKFTAQDLSMRAKRLGNRYSQLLTEAFNPYEDFMDDADAFVIYLSLLGLTCEIYIKSILYWLQPQSVANWIKGHSLSDLYKLIPKELQQKIEADFSCQLPNQSYEENLKKLDLFFYRFRYAYEIDGYAINLNAAQVIFEIFKKCANENQ